MRQQRHALGLSQKTLGQRATLHRTYIADIERGARNPSLESIARIASALEIPMTALFQTLRYDETSLAEQAALAPEEFETHAAHA